MRRNILPSLANKVEIWIMQMQIGLALCKYNCEVYTMQTRIMQMFPRRNIYFRFSTHRAGARARYVNLRFYRKHRAESFIKLYDESRRDERLYPLSLPRVSAVSESLFSR